MSASKHWLGISLLGIIFIAATTIAAFVTKLWVLTALPIGFLFGFFLQKGDLCGSSAFSEVILMKDWRKVSGLWIAIVVSMLVFAVGSTLGWIQLNPKPMIWANYIIGGVVFGVGTVLAGGCISGCLYKSATGNLNSIVAVIAMPFGIGLVEYGPLHGFFESMKAKNIPATGGGALSLPAVTGISYTALAVIFALITIVAVLALRANPKGGRPQAKSDPPSLERAMTRPWKPWQAGLAIGILALAAYVSSASTGRNYPLGVTHGVLFVQTLVTERDVKHVYEKPPAAKAAAPKPDNKQTAASEPAKKKVVWWLVLLIGSLMLGSFTSGKLSGQAKLLPKPPEQTLVAILGGLMVGAGAAFAGGCVIGNILSGWALMSIGTILFGIVVVLANWTTTYFYLMGGKIRFGKK